MRLQPYLKFLLANSFLFCLTIVNAQYTEADSVFYQQSKQHVIDLYHQYISTESGLYNGSQYIVYAHTIQDGIPFFQNAELNKGDVFYNAVLYKNVPLQYDVLKGLLITVIPTSNYLIQLNNDKVTSFSLLNHHFVRLVRDSSDKNIKTGFYDVLYNGNIGVYQKEIKTLGEDLSSGKLRTFVFEANTFYIKKDNNFYVVTTKKSVLHILKDRKKEIQDFIRKNKLNIYKEKDIALPKIAAYYDELSKQKK